jgi:hypothetical protein
MSLSLQNVGRLFFLILAGRMCWNSTWTKEDNDAPSANYRKKRAANWPEDVDFVGTGARRHAPLDRSATLVGGRQ